MKRIKSLLAIVLACVLALGLFACSSAEPEEPVVQVPQTALEVVQSDPLAYLNALIGLISGTESFNMEANYGLDDIEAGNETLQAGKDVIKGNITSFLNKSVSYKAKPAEDEDPVVIAESCPALLYTLLQSDLLEELVVSDVLELRVAERLEALELDIAEGRNSSMKGKPDADKRDYVLEQMGENAVNDAKAQYQIEGKLSLSVIDKLFAPADKAEIMEQLALAKEYVAVEDYEVIPTELTLFVSVNKIFVDEDKLADEKVTDPTLTKDHIRELTFTQKADLTAKATGAGAFAEAGEFTTTLTLTKTLRFKDITWEAPAAA